MAWLQRRGEVWYVYWRDPETKRAHSRAVGTKADAARFAAALEREIARLKRQRREARRRAAIEAALRRLKEAGSG